MCGIILMNTLRNLRPTTHQTTDISDLAVSLFFSSLVDLDYCCDFSLKQNLIFH